MIVAKSARPGTKMSRLSRSPASLPGIFCCLAAEDLPPEMSGPQAKLRPHFLIVGQPPQLLDHSAKIQFR